MAMPGGSAGASTVAGSPGSAGAPSGFQPCPDTGPCKVLPLGDSITDGLGFNGGYRVELFRLARQDNKDLTFVGRKMNGPNMVDGATFPRSHEGYSGYLIGEIDAMVPSPALDPKPNIVLVHLGTNDMNRMPQGAPGRLGALMDQILTALPDSLLVVSSLIPLPFAAQQVTAFNAEVPKLVSERAAAGKHVIYADQFKGFPESELGDGVHPNQAGYARMAGVWYAAIEPYLR